MAQVLISGIADNVTANATRYIQIVGAPDQAYDANENRVSAVFPTAGTLTRLLATLSAAPGASESITLTVYLNGAAPGSGLVVTLSDSETQDGDTANSVAIDPGDTVSLEVTATASIAATQLRFSMLFTPTDEESNVNLGGGGSSNAFGNGTTLWLPLSGTNLGGSGGGSGRLNAETVIPAPGTIQSLYTDSVTAPGVGETRTATVWLNGVSQAAQLQAQESGATSGASDTTGSITVAKGDRVAYEIVASAGCAATRGYKVSTTFIPNTDDQAIITAKTETKINGASAATRYYYPAAGNGTYTTTETDRRQGGQAMTATDIVVWTSDTWSVNITFTLLVNGVASALVANGTAGGSDATGSANVTIEDYDELSIEINPDGIPDDDDISISLAAQVTPPTTTANGNLASVFVG